jgi:hypothetical protein
VADLLPLPALITLNDLGGDWNAYLEGVYGIFRRDFLDSRPTFRGTLVGHRKYEQGGNTLPSGKEATFWHLISEGPNEEDRIPDMRRCERIAWVRHILDHAAQPNSEVRVWTQNRNGKLNFALAPPSFEYIVIMGWREPKEGRPYAIPLTAFDVKENKRGKYKKEWETNVAAL